MTRRRRLYTEFVRDLLQRLPMLVSQLLMSMTSGGSSPAGMATLTGEDPTASATARCVLICPRHAEIDRPMQSWASAIQV